MQDMGLTPGLGIFHCCKATKPVGQNYWACHSGGLLSNQRNQHNEKSAQRKLGSSPPHSLPHPEKAVHNEDTVQLKTNK